MVPYPRRPSFGKTNQEDLRFENSLHLARNFQADKDTMRIQCFQTSMEQGEKHKESYGMYTFVAQQIDIGY